jgi:hypothetical protein
MSRGISAPQSRPPWRSACTRGGHRHIQPCFPVRPHARRAQCLRRSRQVRRHRTELAFSAAYAGEWQHWSAAAGSDRSSPHATAVHACDASSRMRTHAQMDTGSARHGNAHVSRWCAEKSPMGSVTCSENNRGRAQGCLHASLFHPLTLFIHSHFENTHVGPPRPAPQSPTGRGYGGTPGSHSPHHRAPRDWARMRILAVSFLKKVALNQLH